MKRLVISAIMVVVLLAVAGVGVTGAQDPGEACFQRGGMWDTEQGRCILRSSIELEVAVPLNYEAYLNISSVLIQFVDTTRAEFLGNALLYGAFSQPVPVGWFLSVTYEEYTFSPAVVSVVFSIYQYTGGANGLGGFESFVFDLAQDRELAMSELFQPGVDYLGTLAPLVRQDISAQFGIPVTDQWLVDGTAPVASNYRNFAITPTEFLVFFDEYQVAAGAAGAITARVPLAQLSAILAPAFQP